jgi:hypothetical protein
MSDNPQIKALRPGRTVRISMPASVAFDLDSFRKGMEAVLERLNCPQCCSGYDLTFQLERAFVVNENFEVRGGLGIEGLDPDGEPILVGGVTATLPTQVSQDLGKLQETVARIAERLGHPQCTSGFDLAFRQERDFIVDENLNIHPR